MKIFDVYMPFHIERKVLAKHNIILEDVNAELFDGEPLILVSKEHSYIAITLNMAIVFKLDKTTANIITAYRPSKWQINLYHRKK